MDKVSILLNFIEEKKPFCFIKMNDGEINALLNPNASLSRGLDKSSDKMSSKLKEALIYEQDNYFVGLPCNKCYGSLCDKIKTMIPHKKKENILLANLLINSNMNTTTQKFQTCFQDRHVIMVCNQKMSKNLPSLKDFGIFVNEVYIVADKLAFSTDYDQIRHKIKDIPDNSVVLACCGPLGRVLCYEWFSQNSSLTCIELGSYFDPILNDKSYLYHTGTLQHCGVCNVNQDSKDCDLMKFVKNKIVKECYYFQDVNGAMGFYGGNKEKVIKNFENRMKNNYDQNAKDCLDEINKEKIKKEEEEKMKRVKRMSKTHLYNEACHLYHGKKMNDMVKVGQLYLDYFGHLDEKQTKDVLFFQGCAYFQIDREKAIINFEKLLNEVDCPKHIQQYSEWNLDLLYPKNKEPIPKIIHLIYFKERALQLYHYGCVMSMIEHLPDYQIKLYNDKEPEGNKYWDAMKEMDRIEIVPYKRPVEFDGFHLGHVQYAADVTRLELLYEHGGVYMDLDMLIFQDFTEFISKKDLYISYEGGNKGPLINSFLAAKPKNDFIKLWLDSFKTGLRMEKWAYHIGHSNKQLLEKNKHFILKYKIECMESKYFFNYPWPHYDKFHNIEKYKEEFMYGIHLFDTIHHGILKNNKYFKKFEIEEKKENIQCVIEKKESNNKNLVYSCVFFNEKYINLVGLLLRSYHLFGFDESIQYVIFTNKEFEPKVRSLCESLGFSFDIWVLDLNTFFESAYCRLMIFDYPHIQDYSKILYLDCDILIGNCIKPLFQIVTDEILYTLKEATTKDKNHGGIFFENDYPETSTFTTGVLLFKNCNKIKQLFSEVLVHISEYLKTHTEGPGCLDQPFVIYHALTKKMYNNELLEGLVINNPKEMKDEIIYHFPSLVGVYETKIHYMNDFLKKLMNSCKKSDLQITKVKNQKYIWENNHIEYLENGSMKAWGNGKYFFIKDNLLQADFGGQSHLIRFYDDYRNYTSVRKRDFEIVQGNRMEDNLVKKVALCFFGLTRSLKFTIDSIQDNILDVLKDNKIEYTIYLHSYDLKRLDLRRSQEKNCILDPEEYKLLKPDYVKITHQEDFDKSFDWEYVKKFGDPWGFEGNNFENLYNLFRQLNSIKLCTQLWQEHDEYDCYLYLRPDLNYVDKLDINELNLVSNNKNSILTPEWMRDNGLNDRFAFGSKKSILRWANRIDDRFEYEKEFHSEKYLNWVINKYNIHNYFMNMKAYRIRANGEKHHGDINYLNLKIIN